MIKEGLKGKMKAKSSVFQRNYDVDIEIDYIHDQIRSVSSDLVMDLKVQNLKNVKELEKSFQLLQMPLNKASK